MQTILHTRRRASKKTNDVSDLLKYSQQMKSEPTPSELIALQALLAGSFSIESQVVFGFYILDFVVIEKLTCIEIDGSSHDNKGAYDKRRDAFVKATGLKVLRVSASEAANTQKLVEQLPAIKDFKKKWLKAQEIATKKRSDIALKQESIARTGRKNGYERPFYTPKREQAHVIAEARRKEHLANSKADTCNDVLLRKRLREERRAIVSNKWLSTPIGATASRHPS